MILLMFCFVFSFSNDSQMNTLNSSPNKNFTLSFYCHIFGQELFFVDVTRETIDRIKEVRELLGKAAQIEPFHFKHNAVFLYCIDDAFRPSLECWKMEVKWIPLCHSWSLKHATSRPTVWDCRWSSANIIVLSPMSTWQVRDKTLICSLLKRSLISNAAKYLKKMCQVQVLICEHQITVWFQTLWLYYFLCAVDHPISPLTVNRTIISGSRGSLG